MKAPIFIDIDGTLLNSKHELTPRTKDALVKARLKGHPIVICSGRCYDGLKSILDCFPFKPWTITLNGAYVLDDEMNLIHQDLFELDDVLAFRSLAKKHNSAILYFFNEHWGSDADKKANEVEYSITHQKGIDVPLPTLLEKQSINKFLSWGKNEDCLQFLKEARNLYPKHEIVMSSSYYVEVNTPGSSKGNAIRKVNAKLGLDTEDSICFGDYYNDISMFQVVGQSVAMGNAVDDVKRLAKYITKTNDEDGLALWIENNLI